MLLNSKPCRSSQTYPASYSDHASGAGLDLPTVQRISGHKTLEMVVRYSDQNGEHIQAAMDKLERRYEVGS